MELHQLRYFCAIARSGSFTRAAEEERIAQPSLSQQIQKLEIEVGAPLLLRLGRSVQLTEFGEAFLPKAKTVLRELEDARRAIDASPGLGDRGRMAGLANRKAADLERRPLLP